MIFCGLALQSQESRYHFTWLSDPDHQRAGVVVMSYYPSPSLEQLVVKLSVEWYNDDGYRIPASGNLPFLYLSYIGLEINPSPAINCETFADQAVYQIFFQENSELVFNIVDNLSTNILLSFSFQYAFSESDISNGRTFSLGLPSETKINLEVPFDILLKNEDDSATQPEDQAAIIVREKCEELNSYLASLSHAKDLIRRKSDSLSPEILISSFSNEIAGLQAGDSVRIRRISDELQIKHTELAQIVADVDSILPRISYARDLINSDHIPPDSSSGYFLQTENIRIEVGSIKRSFIDYRIQIRNLVNNIGVHDIPANFDAERILLSNNYLPVFQIQLDSVKQILVNHNVNMLALEPELHQLPAMAVDNGSLDSLVGIHNMLKAQLSSIRVSHQESYLQYLSRTASLGPVAEIDIEHRKFEESFLIASSAFDQTDVQVERHRQKIDKIASRGDYRVLWYGGGGLLILILLIIVQQIARNRKRAVGVNTDSDSIRRKGMKGSLSLLDDFDDESQRTNDLYPLIPAKIPDQVVAEIQFSFRAIKAINQVVQGAISRKVPLDFGGFLFGRQYKATGIDVGQSILMIDQIVFSSTIRDSIESGIDSGEDLVDELDRVVSQNKTSVLLGWYSAVNNATLEMNEELMKIHRTFFREKWQIAILVNPGTATLAASMFLRRKSGFFEASPVKENLFNLEDLYQYALNPPLNTPADSPVKHDLSEYISVNLNDNWCDSIVQKVSILPDILVNLQKDREIVDLKLLSNVAAGYFYGNVETTNSSNGKDEYIVFINRFVEVTNGDLPREIPGSNLIGWLYFGDTEASESLKEAIPYHENNFSESYQVCVLVNISTNELRVFSRKHSLEMNNNVIETEEFNLLNLILSARKATR